eukprot:CAMPEP_0201568048 /NCGR_PEP_ID=MMETSP0190_2-20130828/8894_1 /ASSEMBLY_ACC=CAM_ASM_000263 /TAXON_ID=37353 /ORGANISM="Rosalina sp." /LENGTH=147 /DNA_ID=CAMNT_0047988737 /DNA_START=1161 /DNA_END=1604 /DNA_ORIENTATION=-
MLIATKFEDLQQRQESLIETQKFVMRCDKVFDAEVSDYEDEKEEDDDIKEQEMRPLVNRSNNNSPRKNKRTSILDDDVQLRMELTWYQRNVAFIDDTLSMVHRKDIIPKLYKTKLNTVLVPAIGMVGVSGIVILLKLFVEILLGDFI